MVNFIVIGILLVLIVFMAFKWNNLRTKTAFFFIFIGICFLLLTGYLVLSGKNIDFSSVKGVSSAVKTYVAWIINAGANVVKVTTYAFNQEWKDKDVNNTEAG